MAASDPIAHVVQHTSVGVGEGIWSFPIISNHIIMQIVAAAVLVWFIPKWVLRRAGDDEINRLVPKGFGNALEALCTTLKGQIFDPNLGKYSNAFTPYLWSLFFFILTCNLLGLLPLGDWFFFIPGHQIGGTSTANIYVTGALAVVTLVMVGYNGWALHGVEYAKHTFMGPWWISWFIAILEVIGFVVKHTALCLRLFANMVAGHILLAVLLGFIEAASQSAGGGLGGMTLPVAGAVIVVSIAIMFLELLVAFLHAFIFTTLTAVFLGQAVNMHHDDEHEHDEHAEDNAGAVGASH